MKYKMSRLTQIEILAGNGDLNGLKACFANSFSQLEIDEALGNAIAYSRIEVASFLLELGADITYGSYDGTYYAVHNNELEGLKFAISKGVDINVNNGMLLNTSIQTAINTKSCEIVSWMLNNGARVELLTKLSHDWISEYASAELKLIIYGA